MFQHFELFCSELDTITIEMKLNKIKYVITIENFSTQNFANTKYINRNNG